MKPSRSSAARASGPQRVAKASPAAWEFASPADALRALLREQRGDGHVAVLTLGASGRECNVLHAAAGRVPKEMIMRSRDYDDEQWHFHQDRLALPVLDTLDDDEVEALFRALTPITRKVVPGGDVPAATPMGLSRDDLDDDSAHLA